MAPRAWSGSRGGPKHSMGTGGGKKEKRADRSKTPRHARLWFAVKLVLLGALAVGEGQGGVSSLR
jgi:hypothetical protein